MLDTAPEITEFLSEFVFDATRPYIRRHIGVCHDICHSAVMFESQDSALIQYLEAGVRVGKVQVSSAIEVPWHHFGSRSTPQSQTLQQQARQQLSHFNEPKYLHQTTRAAVDHPRSSPEMVEDLGIALDRWLSAGRWPDAAWRIHFMCRSISNSLASCWPLETTSQKLLS